MELYRLANQLVGAYQYVYLPCLKVGKHSLGLLGAAGPGEVIHTHWEVFQPLAKRLVVLVCEHSGRHEHSHLLRVAGRLERRPHRNLGLAEANIAADKAVHGPLSLHVGLHVCGCLELVGGVLVKETRLQFMLHERVLAESIALFVAPLGIKLDQVTGNVLYLFLRPLLQVLPLPCAKMAEPRRLPIVLGLVL